jgi:hypothetical protein
MDVARYLAQLAGEGTPRWVRARIADVEAATGVPNPSLIRFFRGDQDLKLASAEAIMKHFGIVARREKLPKSKREEK